MNGNWNEAPERFVAEVLPAVRRHGDRIAELFEAGDPDAVAVVRSYRTLQRSFDPVNDLLIRCTLRRMGMMP